MQLARMDVRPRRLARRLAAVALAAVAGCGGSSGPTSGVPAQLVVTVVQGTGTPQVTIGFPTSLPHGSSTLVAGGLDSAGRQITLDPARYRWDVTPLVVGGTYLFSVSNNVTYGLLVTQAATLPVQWRVTDVVAGRVILGPVTANVVFQ
jgi:hypothetical protein